MAKMADRPGRIALWSWWALLGAGAILLVGVAAWRFTSAAMVPPNVTETVAMQSPGQGDCYSGRTAPSFRVNLRPSLSSSARPRPPQPRPGADIEQLKREKELAAAEGDKQYAVTVMIAPFRGKGNYTVRDHTVIGYAPIPGVRADLDGSGRPASSQWTSSVPVLGDGVAVRVQTLGRQTRMWTASAGQITVAAVTSDRASGSLDVLLAPAYARGVREDDQPIHLSGSWECQVSTVN